MDVIPQGKCASVFWKPAVQMMSLSNLVWAGYASMGSCLIIIIIIQHLIILFTYPVFLLFSYSCLFYFYIEGQTYTSRRAGRQAV